MKFYLSMFCFIILKTNVESVELNIKPSTTIQPGAPSFTIRCQPYPGEVSSIYDLYIKRNNTGTDDIMGTVQVGKSPELGTGFGSPKYNVSGSIQDINSVSSAFLEIVIQDPDCNDKGEYVCSVTGAASDGSTVTPEKRSSVTVQENPSDINMYITPQFPSYDIDTTISMSCNGNVGNPRKTWQWQTRRFPDSTRWVRLTDGVVDGDVTPPTGASCSYRQQTALNYVVKSQDAGQQIRCILDDFEDFARNYTIHLKVIFELHVVGPFIYSMSTSPTTSSAPPVTSSVSTSPTTSSVNPSENVTKLSVTDTTAVTVLGVLVALLVVYGVVISLIAVSLYRKLKGESKQTQESTYESVQHSTTPNSVYTSLDNAQYLTPTSVNQ